MDATYYYTDTVVLQKANMPKYADYSELIVYYYVYSINKRYFGNGDFLHAWLTRFHGLEATRETLFRESSQR